MKGREAVGVGKAGVCGQEGFAQQSFVLVVGAEWGWGGHGLSWSFLRRIGATLYLAVHVME